MGRDGRQDRDRILRVLEDLDADLIALQEVTWSDGGADDPPSWLRALPSTELAAASTLTLGEGRYGIALVARGRILDRRIHDLSVAGREPRVALECRVEVDGARGTVIATHLGLTRRERSHQAGRLQAILQALPEGPPAGRGNVALMGDVNEWLPWCAALSGPRAHFGPWPSVRSYPTPVAALAIDRIWSAPLGPREPLEAVRTPRTRVASDHYPVRMKVRWIR